MEPEENLTQLQKDVPPLPRYYYFFGLELIVILPLNSHCRTILTKPILRYLVF